MSIPTTSLPADSAPPWSAPVRIVIEALVVLGAALPVYLLIKQALTPDIESFAWPPRWMPHNLTLAHLKGVFELAELRSALILSVCVAAVAALVATALGTMLAYAMARRERLRQAGMAGVTAARLLPMIAVALPLTIVLIHLGLYDSPTGMGLALIHAALAIPTTALTTYGAFVAIPREQEEAAFLDGASALRIFLAVDVPQARAAIAASIVLSLIMSWDEFGFALLIQVTHRTLPPLLYYYTVFGDVGPASALALVMLLPALVVIIALRPMLKSGLIAETQEKREMRKEK
ncbi:MAG TPA: carbohydrate ABC transporter permease [Candidatus Binataceae bacterium]|jgi:ABC-type glycerol-3-phosphate transport system permease component|nr:carbohydrate ABC transporter permease [Candidatus Binataceae bacterium]